MKGVSSAFFLIMLAVAAVSSTSAFTASLSPRTALLSGAVGGGSSFVVSSPRQQQQKKRTAKTASTAAGSSTGLHMASQAKFGLFSPAVYATKFAIGQARLNKIRGKAISLHSQAIGEFCMFAGAYHMRTRLIKLAKNNGNDLGFLV